MKATNCPPAIWRKSQNIHKLLGQKAKIISYSNVCNGPYIVMVQLANKKRMMLELVQSSAYSNQKVQVGNEVILILRKSDISETGLINYVIKAKLT